MPSLHWIGKDKVVNHHLDVPFRVLEKQYCYKDENSENKIIHGDNLEALKALLPEYEGKVKCIYIDPPYNTGNESWVYNDNVNHPKIKKWLGEVVGKEGEDLSRHDKWLCMMYPRLKLLHKLLRQDGVIFISIDDNEQAHLKLIMDEIFGAGNFIVNVIWHKRYAASNDSKGIPDMHDFILAYRKSEFFQRNLMPRTDKQNNLYKYDSNDGRGKWRPDNLSVKTYSKDYDYPIINKITNKEYFPPKGRCWVTNKETMEKWIEESRVFFGQDGKGAPQLKRYLNEVQQGVVPVSLWSYEEVNHTDGARKTLKEIFLESQAPFQTPKPYQLIQRVLQISTNPTTEDIILDSFAGSGTTAHAVLKLNKEDGGNRKFILIEMEDYAETITAERVKRVINGYGTQEGTGGSFEYYELGNRLFDERGNLNEDIGLEKIRQYVYFTETRQALNCSVEHDDNNHLMAVYNDTAYYFYYERKQITTLDHEFLATIKTKADCYVIYADNCILSKEFLAKYNIIFKKIPRDISRL